MSKSLKESTSQTPTLNALDSLADALRFYAAPKNWGPVADYSDGYWYMSGRPWMRAYAALKDAGVDVSLLAEPEQEAPERAGEELADALVAAADFAQAMKAERDEAIRALSDGMRVPDGWKLVPVEPTQAMKEAPSTVIQAYGAGLIYKRMLEAAPEYQSHE